MKAINKFIFTHILLFILATVAVYLIFINITLPGDWIQSVARNGYEAGETRWGFLSVFYILLWIASSVSYLIYIIGNVVEEGLSDTKRDDEWFEKNTPSLKNMKLKTIIIWLIVIFSGIWITKKAIKKTSFIYNTSVVYNKNYDQVKNERIGYYDNMWKTYMTKEKIALMNKDVFIEVASLQLEARKDGSQVAWKWVQENTQIPYSEFTKFYSDLSNYIESKREGYYALEKKCMSIVTSHNMMIDTFPNNLWNKIVGRKHLEFNYGFTSDSTQKVFSTRKENIK